MPLSRQEVFNIVWQTFVVEHAPRSVQDSCCMYSHINGGKGCAIGCLFKPEEISLIWEGQSIEPLFKRAFGDSDPRDDAFKPLREKLSPEDLAFYQALQSAHDNEGAFPQIEQSLRTIAQAFNLNIPES